MTDRELIKKLNNLNNVNPEANWLKTNRELLLSQISNAGAENLTWWKTLLITVSSFSQTAAKPVYALAAFVLLLATGLFLSQPSLSRAKPNDSLYIARVIAEQVRLSTTFNSDARAKLAVQYATHQAQDLSAVLSDPQFNTSANQEQVAQLSSSLQNEVDTVKDAISVLNNGNSAPAAPARSVARSHSSSAPAATTSQSDSGTSSDFMIADSSKNNKGIEMTETVGVSESTAVKTEDLKSDKTVTTVGSSSTSSLGAAGSQPEINQATGTATTASSSGAAASSTPAVNSGSQADKILNEVQQLLNKKDYNQAADKLQEINKIIQN